MKKIVANKWVVMAVLLFLSLTVFALFAVHQTAELSSADDTCLPETIRNAPQGEMPLDMLSRQFTLISMP